MSSKTLKNSVTLLSANVAAQLIGFLFYPLLTRLYSAQDFGILNLFFSIGGLLALVATADYQYAIVLPKSEKKAVSVFQFSFLLALGVVLLCGLSVFFRYPVTRLFKAPELAVFYPLLPVFVLLSSVWNLFNYWFTRQEKFGAVAAYQVSQTLGNSMFKYASGKAGWLHWGLIASTIASLFVSLGAVLFSKWKICRVLLHGKRSDLRSAAIRYRRFPLFSLPRTVVNSLSCNLPVFLLTPCFGLTEMGYLGMALTLAFRPVNMVAASLYQVFFQKAAKNIQQRQPALSFFRRFVLWGGLSVSVVFFGLYFVLPELAGWFLGDGWQATGHYIRLMLPWLALTAIGNCINFVSDLFQKQAVLLAIETVYLFLRVAALTVGIVAGNIRLAVLLYSLVSAAVIAFQIFWFFSLFRRYEHTLTENPAGQ